MLLQGFLAPFFVLCFYCAVLQNSRFGKISGTFYVHLTYIKVFWRARFVPHFRIIGVHFQTSPAIGKIGKLEDVMKKYEFLKGQYPAAISMNQLYQICKISKLSAAYLIKHGIIPATDTGKKTWRWRIELDDVISYLHKRDRVGSMIPRGAVNSQHKRTGKRVSFASHTAFDNLVELAEYFVYIYSEYPDVLNVADITEMTGLCEKTILKFLRDGDIKVLERQPKYLVAKSHLLEFVASAKFTQFKSSSDMFKKIIGGFVRWKTAKS